MSSPYTPEPNQAQLLEVQTALFNLRDGLLNLKMSLQELAFMTDEAAQTQAVTETNNLLLRLRG
jgi:hypothetical protein